MQSFLKYTFILQALCLAILTGCDSSGKDAADPATLVVGTEAVELAATADAAQRFTITTSAMWTATVSGAGFTLDKTEGTGNAEITVTATEANTDTETIDLGSVVIAAKGVEKPHTVLVRQLGTDTPGPAPDPDPEPGKVTTIAVDFGAGIAIATPALPDQKDNAQSGLQEYKIAGFTFTVFADPGQEGRFYWIDNTKFSPSIPAPNKGLYFSKLGAYIKFPSIAGKVLTKVVYSATSSQSGDTQFDLLGGNGEDIQYTLDAATMTYELIDPVPTARLEIINSKNAQAATLELTYSPAAND